MIICTVSVEYSLLFCFNINFYPISVYIYYYGFIYDFKITQALTNQTDSKKLSNRYASEHLQIIMILYYFLKFYLLHGIKYS